MKAKYLVAPALALVAVVAWNVHQHRSLKEVEEKTTKWEERIESSGGGPSRTRVERRNESSGGDKGPLGSSNGGVIDWRQVSQRLADMEESLDPADMREMMAFHEKVAGMSDTELVAAISEVEALGLDEDSLEMLQEVLIEPLIEKNPELALEQYKDRIEDDPDGIGWMLSFAMEEWAAKDVKSAEKWLDDQIAAGLFESKSLDGRSESRLEFEAALLGELLDADPEAAARRVAVLQEDERRETMEQVSFTDLSPDAQKAYAALIRNLVPEDERAGSFAYLVEDVAWEGGYDAVDEFLERVNATPEERAVSARQAASSMIEEIADERSVTGGDIEEMRTWLAKYDPESLDKRTGRAIADATQDCSEFPYEDAEKLARQYFQKSGNEQVIISFLESFAARSNLDQALPLAELIADPARREKILDRLK
ncbi:MAG: hypothetical protein KDN05_06955 [Verrucomicrobiae bacterium]|nr:hypothetical protein [Verrucomicrobiae bacterium]